MHILGRHIQPLFIAYLAMGIYYISRFMGISTFVCERNKKYQRQRQVQTGALRLKSKHRRRCFHLRIPRMLRWYSNILVLLITTAVPFALYTLYTEMHFLALTQLLTIVGNMRYVLIEGFTVFVLISNCCRQHRLMRFINRWLRMQNNLFTLARCLKIRSIDAARLHRLDRRSSMLLCIKIMMLMPVAVFTVYVIYKEKAIHRLRLLAALIFNCFCAILGQVLMLMYYGCALRVGHYGKQINVLIQYALAEARQHLNGLHPLNVHRRNRVFCLCKVIKRLHYLYGKNLQLSRELLQIYTPSLITCFFYVLLYCTVQLFVLYFLTCSHKASAFKSGGPMMEKDGCSTPNPLGLIVVFCVLADTCLLVFGTHLMQKHISATSSVLAEGSVELPLPRAMCRSRCCELQLEAALAEFALYLRMKHQQQHRLGERYVYFMVCGLFALERRLIFVIFESILNYLIILIQYDKVT